MAGKRSGDTTGIDRVGLGWRPEIASALWLALDRIDLVEVIADDLFDASRAEIRSMAALARDVPLVLHGVGLGLASATPVDPWRLDRIGRLVDRIDPSYWSEHLAFVRAGGIEIGHMAAAPWRIETVAGAVANIEAAARVVGAAPVMENIATLVAPPASTMDEGRWTRSITEGSAGTLLLDLHNLYANAVNFGHDPIELLESMPLECVRAIHLSGGVNVRAPSGAGRLLDDHLHDPPDPVYALLEHVAARVPQALDVVIERDGDYPAIEVLLGQIDRARAALARGRGRRDATASAPEPTEAIP